MRDPGSPQNKVGTTAEHRQHWLLASTCACTPDPREIRWLCPRVTVAVTHQFESADWLVQNPADTGSCLTASSI